MKRAGKGKGRKRADLIQAWIQRRDVQALARDGWHIAGPYNVVERQRPETDVSLAPYMSTEDRAWIERTLFATEAIMRETDPRPAKRTPGRKR